MRATRLAAILVMALLATLGWAQYYGTDNAPELGTDRAATTAPGNIRVDQKLNAQVPLDLPFIDEQGEEVVLNEFFGDKPVILMLIFYKCTGICTDEFNNMARMVESMNTAMPGEDFEIVTVSINPEERPIHAQSRKDTVIGMTGKPEAAEGWHFLTGEWNNIVALADSVGFRFTYEPRENEDPNIVHPAGIMILTPTGKVSRYFLSTEYPGQLVLNALEEAEQESIGIRDDNPVVLACIQIGVLNSDRTLNILNTLKLAGVLTIAIAAFSVGVMSINRKRKIYDKNKGGNGDAA